MSVPGKDFALVFIVALLLEHEQCCCHVVEAERGRDVVPLDLRILRALEGLVDALGSRLHMTYVDAASGLYFASDRLQNVLNMVNTGTGNDSLGTSGQLPASFHVSVEEIRALQRKTTQFGNTAVEQVLQTTNVPILSRGVLRHNFWTDPPIPAGVEPVENASGSAPHRSVTESTSDACMTQLFSGARCRDVNSTCWETMTGGKHRGYNLAHQVLFLTIAFKMNCTAVMERFSELYGQPPAARNLASKCAQVAKEAQSVAEGGFPDRKRDLFLEQVTVCGFLDRGVFKNTSFMEAALSWQRNDGCFESWMHRKHRKHRRRVKREERVDDDGCSMHMTSVGAAALATWLGTLVRDELQGRRLVP
ncbi:UPF0764 protein C16orf89 homolog [Rhipicephalus sanguineus]|uniref:UPF0764 protein C16orf89 homolog n=1 Tax=Rhipicephalus sanguineus TaxID=34632 RepID=UPI001895AA32|nr:UPF0764 protein C16orf89 homolog [Rhipicephalus sanguineus]